MGEACRTAARAGQGARLSTESAIFDLCIGSERCDPIAQALHARGVPLMVSSGRDIGDFAARFPGTIMLPKPFDFAALKGSMGRVLAAR